MVVVVKHDCMYVLSMPSEGGGPSPPVAAGWVAGLLFMRVAEIHRFPKYVVRARENHTAANANPIALTSLHVAHGHRTRKALSHHGNKQYSLPPVWSERCGSPKMIELDLREGTCAHWQLQCRAINNTCESSVVMHAQLIVTMAAPMRSVEIRVACVLSVRAVNTIVLGSRY